MSRKDFLGGRIVETSAMQARVRLLRILTRSELEQLAGRRARWLGGDYGLRQLLVEHWPHNAVAEIVRRRLEEAR